jgi:hypothetical protein
MSMRSISAALLALVSLAAGRAGAGSPIHYRDSFERRAHYELGVEVGFTDLASRAGERS